MYLKRAIASLVTVFVTGAYFLVGAMTAAATEMGAVNEPIKLALNESTGTQITARIAGEILTRMGYKVEYVNAGYYSQMPALEDGTITATLEIWTTSIGDLMAKAVATGNVVALDKELGLQTLETWFYNNAAKDACPGLPKWEALKNCADKFADASTYPDGRLLDYPVEWGTTNVQRLKALGLPFKSVPAGSEGSLIVEIKAAEEKKQPLLAMFWTPQWLHADLELHPVELPTYFEGCYENASAGVNPDSTYDCASLQGPVWKLAWVGMKDKWPAAFKVLTSYQLTNEAYIPMMAARSVNGTDLDTVTKKWMDEHEAVWKPWIEDAMK